MIDAFHFVDDIAIKDFVLKCQSSSGGFSKYPDMYPDVLHSYYSICWLSMIHEDGFLPLECAVGISCRALNAAGYTIPKVS
jgi:geranylgeranyl transferase type-1 subunit beta